MRASRKYIRVIKLLLAGVTVFCVSWIASINEWHSGVRWVERRGGRSGRGGQGGQVEGLATMRTIVAYSEGKQAEMDRPLPVACDRMPAFPKIPYFNRSWSPHVSGDSWQRVQGTSVSVYAAYYDVRTTQRYVRILAIFHGRNISSEEPLFCQTRPLNAKEESIEVVAAKALEMWWHEWDATSSEVETPLLLSCPLTDDLNSLSVVSIVTEPCDDPSNAFVLNPKDGIINYKRSFTICVKDMKFTNNIARNLVEWIEANKILGVDRIDAYIDEINKETEEVLLYYKNQGYVRLFNVPIKHTRNRTLWQRRRDHLITYNDCLYRNLAESEYILPLDVDEILLPKIAFNLPELLIRLRTYGWNPKDYSAILVQNVFFFDFMQGVHKYKFTESNSNISKIYIKRDDVRIKRALDLDIDKIVLEEDNSLRVDKTTDLHNLESNKHKCDKEIPIPKLSRHIVRSALVSPVGYYSKSLMLTRRVLTAFNHYPLANLGVAGFAGWSAPFSEVQLNHYKESCNTTMVTECERYAVRARIDRTALRLQPRLTHALSAICQQIKAL
ncbi:hypothetical protein RR46_04448 [Papilio xuthus]|uniref:Glycosyltransferase family 92 protein n=1 Tax=Papilio xuthus TaxID=66420 RepID=A0A194PTC1_PAPXU|nr:hypothetical protein RR46_04448 [Papilio xuthus]